MAEELQTIEVDAPADVALVVLPFPDAAAAATFAQLVQGSTQGATQPLITMGAAYEYVSEEGRFQVVEFHGTWQGYDGAEGGAVVRREIIHEEKFDA